MEKNIFGETLITCSTNPLTGFFRTGCCETDKDDLGLHTICVIVSEKFLQFSKVKGNDLIKPAPQWGFNGLKPGDRWCLCAVRWKEAYIAGCAPKVVLEATNEKTLEIIKLSSLIEYALKK